MESDTFSAARYCAGDVAAEHRFGDYVILTARLTRRGRRERLALPAVARFADKP